MSLASNVIDLGYRPRDWQAECHKSCGAHRFSVLALHRRAGKTELALMELIDHAMRNTQAQPGYAYVAPFLKQAKAIAWNRLKARVGPLAAVGRCDVLEGELRVVFPHNGAEIRVAGADNPDALRGMRFDGVVLDEVAQVKPEVWQDVLQPALSDRKGWAIFIGTPHGVNLFSELFYRAKQLPDWWSSAYTVYDTDALDPEEVARLRRDMTDTSFAREYLCDFSAAGDDQLISLADAQAAASRHLRAEQYSHAPKILGVDPARFGDDRSVVFPRQGLFAGEPHIWRGLDNMTLADRIAGIIDRTEPDAVFIDAGNGAGVIDRLRQLGYDVIEVNFGGSPTHPRFANKRAEMWWAVRDWIAAGGAIPDLIDLKQDLAAPVYYFSAPEKIQLEPKDDIKARGLPSPDLGDALALTFAYPVHKSHDVVSRAKRAGMPTREEAVLDYDPYA